MLTPTASGFLAAAVEPAGKTGFIWKVADQKDEYLVLRSDQPLELLLYLVEKSISVLDPLKMSHPTIGMHCLLLNSPLPCRMMSS